MSSDIKTLKIDPSFFKISGTKKNKNSKKKIKKDEDDKKINVPEKKVQKKTDTQLKIPKIKKCPSLIKTHFINKVKTHEHKSDDSEKSEKSERSEYQDSVNYLSKLLKTQQDQKRALKSKYNRNHTTIKNQHRIPDIKESKESSKESENVIHVELPKELTINTENNSISKTSQANISTTKSSNIPQYGCLKNGNIPTYKTWIKTHKNKNHKNNKNNKNNKNHKNSIHIHGQNKIIEPNIERQTKLKKLKEQNNTSHKTRVITTNTIKKKYKLGKSLANKTISILIKNKNDRLRVINAHKKIKKTSMKDVKQYLKQRGLITSNYMIPPELCRETYESAMLSGDLYNKNHKTLLNNLISE